MKTVLIAAAALAACAAAAPASAAEVEIRNAVARVVVIVEDRQDVAVEVTQGRSRLPALQVRRQGRDVRIDGGLRRTGMWGGDIRNCNAGRAGAAQPGEGASVEVRNLGRVRLEEAPLIVLRTPRDVDVSAEGAVFGAVGRGAHDVRLENAGCGLWNIANISGALLLKSLGTGALRAGISQSATVALSGSSDISVGSNRRFTGAVSGSGSIQVSEVIGNVNAVIGGSGNITIRSGTVDNLVAMIGGSGNITVHATVLNADAAISGSGDVRIRCLSGARTQAVRGSGRLIIGNQENEEIGRCN